MFIYLTAPNSLCKYILEIISNSDRGNRKIQSYLWKLVTITYEKQLGPGHIGNFYLPLFPNKAVFQCIPYGKLKKRVKAT